MSFYGTTFSFNGTSCAEYGLMLYDFGGQRQGASKFTSGVDVTEDRIASRYRSLFYGATQNTALQFTLIFGANETVAANGDPIDRWEMETIASWLTGHADYKWLEIDQPDLENVRYRCIIKDLEMLEHAGNKWAFSCHVYCDSPFAYLCEKEFTYAVKGSLSINLRSRSSFNGYYYPKLVIQNASSVSIANASDGGRVFSLTGLNAASDRITVDNENGTITGTLGMNLYPNFNFNFFRLKRGDNQLTITGTGNYTFLCEFPVNVGG